MNQQMTKSLLILGSVCRKIFKNPKLEGNCAKEGQKVSQRLGHLDAGEAQNRGKDQHQRDEEKSLPGYCKEGGRRHKPHGLHHHITHNDPALQTQREALETQRTGTAFDNSGVIPEQGYELRSKNIAQNSNAQKEYQRYLHAEPEALRHTGVQSCAVIEPADRLEALSESKHGGGTEHGNSLHNAHSRARNVAKGLGGVV